MLNILHSETAGRLWHHQGAWVGCTRCTIGEWAHRHVFCRGALPCDFLFVGEAPGRTEDKVGYPFVGKAGMMLGEWIGEACTGITRWAITNMVCCRPTNEPKGPNRRPSLEELRNCRPRLEDFLNNIAKPHAIVLLGQSAALSWGDLLPTTPRLSLKHPAYFLHTHTKGTSAEFVEVEKLKVFVKEVCLGKL